MDEAGPRSLFLVVSYDIQSPCSTSILQLDTQEHNPDFEAQLSLFDSRTGFKPNPKPKPKPKRAKPVPFVTDIDQKEYVAHFSQPPSGPTKIFWVFTHLESSSELCMVPYWDPQDVMFEAPLHGFIFNFTTNTWRPFHHPQANKFGGYVATHDGYLYFIAAPCWSEYTPDPSFERYDPACDVWETLEPFPWDPAYGSEFGRILATAVLVDTILFNLSGNEIWAYSVSGNYWYFVEVEDQQCYKIVGKAVVIENTIYALTASMPFNLILALSITCTEDDYGDLVYTCSLQSEILVRGMKPFSVGEPFFRTRHLCHMGNDNFCLVESCKDDGFWDYQPIRLTNLKLKEENSMTVTSVCGHLLQFLNYNQFRVDFCFSLPDFKTTALKEGKSSIFDLNPFPEDFDPCKKSNYFISLGDGNTDEEAKGHFVNVINISPLATYSHLENTLKRFGPVRDVKVIKKETGRLFATVEFKSATSQQKAIKASPIVIAGCPAVVE